MDRKSEMFFTELARMYSEQEGRALENEFSMLAAEDKLPQASVLNRKINNKLLINKTRRYGMRVMPLVASLIIAMLVYNIVLQPPSPVDDPMVSVPSAPTFPELTAPATPPQPEPDMIEKLHNSVAFVSTSLPAGYVLSAVDYDNLAAIMEITNERNNYIVLLAEQYQDFDKDGFTELRIHEATAYGLVKNGYSLLKYSKDDMLYTSTSLYGYEDLIEISKNIL